MLFVDTDVLAIHHLFLRDKRRDENEKFLREISNKKPNLTIHNLLELCGLFAVANQLSKIPIVYKDYLETMAFNVYFPEEFEDWPRHIEHILDIVSRGHSYGDALIVSTAEEGGVEVFITWNTRHFKETINATVLSPTEYLLEVN